MKPIETVYNGYRFRSRLEARWAVFFDALGVKYQYEPEGFDLDGEWYLPDFYLNEFKLFVEIKPIPDCSKQYRGWTDTCAKFRDYADRAILLCFGDPYEESYHYLFAWDYGGDSGGSSDSFALFTVCNNVPVVSTIPMSADIKIVLSSTSGICSELVGTPYQLDGTYDKLWNYANNDHYTPDIVDIARLKARQARFEHGAKG